VRIIIDRNYKHAHKILSANIDKLHLMADGLIKYETIDANQIKEIMSGNEPSPPDDLGEVKKVAKAKGSRGKSGGLKDSTAETIVDDPV